MSVFPNGIETRSDAISMLDYLAGRKTLQLEEWDIDDFASAPHNDAKIERCRLVVRDQIIDLLIAKENSKICTIVDSLILELTEEGG
ncbi:MAG: hypothetical protein WA906_08855 [Pacificimonas sp.]